MGRGRNSSERNSTVEYLALLSAKHNLDPDKFFDALVRAKETGKASCGALSVERRSETAKKIMILILKESKVVAQLALFKPFLAEKNTAIRAFMGSEKIRRLRARQTRQSSVLLVRDLRIGMTQVNLKAKVLEVPESNVVYTRYGNNASVTNAVIADETGKIRLCLWNGQTGGISAGDTIQIENATVSAFRGQIQLNIGKKGLLSSADKSSPKLKAVINS